MTDADTMSSEPYEVQALVSLNPGTSATSVLVLVRQ